MKWQAVTFDLDNTLFSHETAFKKAIEECFYTFSEQQNCEGSSVTFNQFFPVFKQHSDDFWNQFERGKITGAEYRRLRFNETMKMLKLPYGDHLSDSFHEQYYKVVDDYSEPFEGVDELFSTLNKADIKTAIITNGTADTQYSKVKKIGVSRWVFPHLIFVSEEEGTAKPDKRIFKLAEESLQEPGNRILHAGDSWKHDVCGALDAGWDAVFVNTRQEKPGTAHKPAAVFSTFSSFKDALIRVIEGRRSL